MRDEPVQAKISLWAAGCTLVALASIYAFLQDLIAPDWPAWVLTPLIVLGFRQAVLTAPQDSLTRAALNQGALLLVPFMGIYGLVDALTKADWPAWVIAATAMVILWFGMATLSEAEAD